MARTLRSGSTAQHRQGVGSVMARDWQAGGQHGTHAVLREGHSAVQQGVGSVVARDRQAWEARAMCSAQGTAHHDMGWGGKQADRQCAAERAATMNGSIRIAGQHSPGGPHNSARGATCSRGRAAANGQHRCSPAVQQGHKLRHISWAKGDVLAVQGRVGGQAWGRVGRCAGAGSTLHAACWYACLAPNQAVRLFGCLPAHTHLKGTAVSSRRPEPGSSRNSKPFWRNTSRLSLQRAEFKISLSGEPR